MSHYIEQQLETVCPLPLNGCQNGILKIQIVSGRGKTKWLNISEDEFLAIEKILLKRLDV